MPLRKFAGVIAAPIRAAHPGRQPWLSRAAYSRELSSVACLGFATACAEAGVVGVIATKAFDAQEYTVALIAAAPAASNITAALWTRLIHGRDRVRATNIFQIATVCCVALMAFAPISHGGLIFFIAMFAAARCFLTGMIAARTDVWRANYPRRQRARMIGAVTILASLIVGLTALAVGRVMDITGNPRSFAAVFAASAVIGLIGVRVFSRIRWRGRAMQISAERHHLSSRAAMNQLRARSASRLSAASSIAQSASRSIASGTSIPAMLGVLRHDPNYRRFMAAQFMLGMPQLAAIPVFIIALKEIFNPDYTRSLGLTQAAITIVPVLVIPFWAPLLDRMHIVRFRCWHSWIFVIANLLMWAAFAHKNEALLYCSRIVLGIATGGGMLAWELGHHDFAPRDRASLYMGVHVFLTGVRGVFSPFLGTMLFAGAGLALFGIKVSIPPMGVWTFAILSGLSATGALMFMSLDRKMRTANVAAQH